jgi:hypothetical protein
MTQALITFLQGIKCEYNRMDLQVFTPGYGNLKDVDEKIVGEVIKGLANGKYVISYNDKTHKYIADPDRYTISIEQIQVEGSRGTNRGFKIIDNYGKIYYKTIQHQQYIQLAESKNPGSIYYGKPPDNIFTLYAFDTPNEPKHTRPLPDYLIDLAKGDYLAYHEKLMSAIMNNRGDASTVTNIGNEPTRFGGKRRRTIKRKSN